AASGGGSPASRGATDRRSAATVASPKRARQSRSMPAALTGYSSRALAPRGVSVVTLRRPPAGSGPSGARPERRSQPAAIATDSFETPPSAGISLVGTPAPVSTRSTFALTARDGPGSASY